MPEFNNNFDLTLDTTGSNGTITRPAQYLNSQGTLTIGYASGAQQDAVYMKVWYDTTATWSRTGSGWPCAGYTNASWIPFSATHATTFSTDGLYYYHVVLMDEVANESPLIGSTQAIVYDVTAPVVVSGSVYMQDPDSGSTTITNNQTGVIYKFRYNDNAATKGSGASGVVSATITGSDIDTITLNNTQLTNGSTVISGDTKEFTGTLNFKTATSGTRTITVKVTDAAGNQSTGVSGSIMLDTDITAPTLVVKNTNNVTVPTYISYNVAPYTTKQVKITLSSPDTDLVGYKIWESTGEAEPSDYTAITGGTAFSVTITKTLSDNAGVKTIKAKVIDNAGTVATATDWTIIVDNAAPHDLSLTTNKQIISKVSGNNVAVLSLAGSDSGTNQSGIANYTITCTYGSTTKTVVSVNASTIPASYSLTGATLEDKGGEGVNTLKLTVTDVAGNSSTTSGTTVILDTTAPSVSINSLQTWYNALFSIILTTSDGASGSGAAYANVWVNETPQDTTVPSGGSNITINTSPQTIASSSIDFRTIAQSATNYLHVKVVDNVGNVAYLHSSAFGYDTVAPSSITGQFTQPVYATTTAQITGINATEATSGIASMQILGDLDNPTPSGTWEAYSATRNVTLSTPDGWKYITIRLKDTAGNESALYSVPRVELDTSKPNAVISDYEPDGITPKPQVTPVSEFVAHLGYTDDTLGDLTYQLWGDFSVGSQTSTSTPQPTTWTALVKDTDKPYMTISSLFLTTGDGPKEIKYRVKDNAGNVSDIVILTHTLDTNEPTVDVTVDDYNVVSKLYVLRRNNLGPIADAYADEMHFTFDPQNNVIKAYKVCAYVDAAAAVDGYPSSGTWQQKNAWVEQQKAIPTAYGSLNTSATGISSSNTVSGMIKGGDLELAIYAASTTLPSSMTVIGTVGTGGDETWSTLPAAAANNTGHIYKVITNHTADAKCGACSVDDTIVSNGSTWLVIPAKSCDGAHIVVVYVQDLGGLWSACAIFNS